MFIDHRADSSNEFVEVLNISMFQTHTRSLLDLQIFLSCIRLHSYELKDRGGASKARSANRQRRVICNLQKFISDSDPIQSETLEVRVAAG